VPWQEREWAKWTDEERDRYLGTSSSPGGGTRRAPVGGSRLNHPLSKGQTILAFAAIAVFVAYAAHNVMNRSPTRTVIEPSSPAVKIAPPRQLPMTDLPSTIPRGTYVTSRGTLGTNVSGPVIVEGRWGSGPWYRLASANATMGTYRVRYLLDRPGFLHLRIALPDGNYLVATTRVSYPSGS
jgi:hypothetical protein